MSLQGVRTQIDRIDYELLKLLHQRMEFTLRAGKQKKVVLDVEREEQVIRNAISASTGLIDEPFVKDIYSLILSHSKKLQSEQHTLVGFQGEAGAWGDIAVRMLAESFVPIPYLEFGDVFGAVRDHEIEFGAVPIENSLEGAVTEVNDLLAHTELHIVNEIVVPIQQNLLILPGSDYREIKVVYSHPQALAQCRGFLSRNKLEPRPYYDTAGAARWLARERPTGAAVIASSLAAQLYGLEVIKDHIEDHPGNRTRFVLLSTEPSAHSSGKCAIVFSTQHHAGALLEILRVFSEEQINLTRIESRPSRVNDGTYSFLLDFLGSKDDPAIQRVLEFVRSKASSMRILGFFKGDTL